MLTLQSSPVVADDDATRNENQRRLEEIEERLNEALKAIERKTSAELDLLDDLDEVDRTLRQKQQKVKRSNRQLAKLKKEIKTQKKDLQNKQNAVEKLQGQVQQRLVSLYK
jgi:chromosome segregation ATPase